MFRNRWLRRLIITTPIVFVLLVGGWFYFRHKTQQQGLAKYQAVTAQIDADDPRWRLDAIDADRGTLPDDQNGALLIPRFKTAIAGKTINPVRPDKSEVFDNVPVNHRLDDVGAAALDRAMVDADAAIAVAREFRHYPRGLRRYRISPDVIGTLLPEVQETRTAVNVLSLEAERLTRAGQPGAALQLVPAMVNAGRSLDGEPWLISGLVRIGCDAVAVKRAERTLAIAVPTGGLSEVQDLLLFEADGDVYWGPLRGERALMDVLFTNVRAGVVPASTIFVLAGAPPKRWVHGELAASWYSPLLAHDHAACLDTLTQMYAVRQLPEAQQRAAMKAVPIPPKAPGSLLTNMLMSNIGKLHDASVRHKAMMRCAGTALAVERFRQINGRWPDTLADLPKELLSRIPTDPFDGQPLKYARRPDGVTIYSVGYDETDNEGAVSDRPSTEPGKDLGFRLFDVDQRGLPPAAQRVTRIVGSGGVIGRGAPVAADKPGGSLLPPPREVSQPGQ